MTSEDIFEEPKEEAKKSEPDFIEDLKNAILASHPTEPLWAESVAIAVYNCIVGRFLTTASQYGSLKTNLNFLCIGQSGSSKTNPTRYYAMPIIKQFDKKNSTDSIRAERWSVEGLYGEIADFNYGLLIREEFTSVFKDTGKGYIGDILEVFSELYDGMAKRRRTVKGGLVQTKEVWISVLGSTTPYIFSLMNKDYFVQGTGNRFLYTMNKQDPKEVDETTFMLPSGYEKEAEITRFVDILSQIYKKINSKQIYVIFMGTVIAKFKNEMTKKVIELNKTDDNIAASYYNRCTEFAIKLSMLKALSRVATIHEPTGGLEENIGANEADQTWAISKVREYIQHFETLRLDWRTSAEKPRAKSDEETIEYVKQALKSACEPIGANEWCKRSHMIWNKWRPIADTLVTQGDVEIVLINGKNKYKIKSLT